MSIKLASCTASAVVLLLLANTVPSTEGANILFFIGFGGPSHRIAMMPLANGLVDEGHNVTILTQIKPKEKDSKINYYVPNVLSKYFAEAMSSSDAVNFYDLRASGMLTFGQILIPQFGMTVCEKLYEDKDYILWVKQTKFDLVFVDGLFNECGYGIAHLHNAKLMVFSISSILPWAIEPLGIPDETSSIPDLMCPLPLKMNFFHRLITAIMPVFWKLYRENYYLPKLEKFTKEGLGVEDFPSFVEIEKNISLTLLNAHVAQELPRSLPSNVIPVGGIAWVEKRKPLPKKMEDFINKGKNGFVYISFGSFIDFTEFAPEAQQKFINGLLRFPNIQFIWKLNEIPENLPDNFYVDSWLPQQDLLLHPKIRAFITHSGIGGVTEAIYSSVPLICFPILSEQGYNANLVEQKGIGIQMEITDFTADELENAIQRILSDNRYAENVKKVNKRFLDRPSTPLQTGLWWTNFVLRQESTDYIRPSSVNLSWWVKRQIDVWIFLCVLLISINVVTIYVIYKIFKRCLIGSSEAKVSKGGKNKKGNKTKLN
ncbi:unnamed protein product [Orchesella dallaii]|uniref:UDP-glucuronosyltransferase n=1 Tax=Orchesella dallaii TaxID=48710 RepID=A0ABP1S5V8_9HEXA